MPVNIFTTNNIKASSMSYEEKAMIHYFIMMTFSTSPDFVLISRLKGQFRIVELAGLHFCLSGSLP